MPSYSLKFVSGVIVTCCYAVWINGEGKTLRRKYVIEEFEVRPIQKII